MNSKTFYFVKYANNKAAVEVIDLAVCVGYERHEFSPVNDENFHKLDEVIQYARLLAGERKLKYKMFESRYNKDLSE